MYGAFSIHALIGTNPSAPSTTLPLAQNLGKVSPPRAKTASSDSSLLNALFHAE
jgi:hypothetical protein